VRYGTCTRSTPEASFNTQPVSCEKSSNVILIVMKGVIEGAAEGESVGAGVTGAGVGAFVGAGVTGAGVTGGSVVGAGVTGAEVTGAGETGAGVTGAGVGGSIGAGVGDNDGEGELRPRVSTVPSLSVSSVVLLAVRASLGYHRNARSWRLPEVGSST